MTREISCPGCVRSLRIADEHAGRLLRCPACNHISVAPPAAGGGSPPAIVAAAESAAAQAKPEWHMRTPEGQVYGPVSWSDLSRWVDEGRIAEDCSLAQSAVGPWRAAAEIFLELKSSQPLAASSEPQKSSASRGASPPSPEFFWGPPPQNISANPHRGGLVLVMGLLGFVVGCPIFSLMAWVMGSHDLTQMRAGRMDRSGEGLTQIGQVLGMILSVFWIIGCVVVLFLILIAAVSGA